MATRLQQVTITTDDFAAGLHFYDATLAALGLVRSAEFGDEEETDAELEAAGWSLPTGAAMLWLVAATAPTRGAHLSLRVDDVPTVQRFFGAAVAAGGRGHTAPRRWTLYRRGEFGAAVFDPRDNVIEVIAPE